MTAQLVDKLPVPFDFPAKGAFSHFVPLDEGVDLAEDRALFHESDLLRVITRTSRAYAGIYTILRANTRSTIIVDMEGKPSVDMEKLKGDMALRVAETSARKFSLAATGGSNPDFYRNFVNNGQDKRMSADVFVGIVAALGRDPTDYIVGADPGLRLPSASVLTSAMAALLETVGVDPFEDERAQKLARRFPDAIRRSAALHGGLVDDPGSPPEEAAPDHAAGQPAA